VLIVSAPVPKTELVAAFAPAPRRTPFVSVTPPANVLFRALAGSLPLRMRRWVPSFVIPPFVMIESIDELLSACVTFVLVVIFRVAPPTATP